MKFLLDNLRRHLGLVPAAETKANSLEGDDAFDASADVEWTHGTQGLVSKQFNIDCPVLAAKINECSAIYNFIESVGDVEALVKKGFEVDEAVDLWVRFEQAIWRLHNKMDEWLKIIRREVKEHGLKDAPDPMHALLKKSKSSAVVVRAIGEYRGLVTVYLAYRMAVNQDHERRLKMVVCSWVKAVNAHTELSDELYEELNAEALKVHAQAKVSQYWAAPDSGGYCRVEVTHP